MSSALRRWQTSSPCAARRTSCSPSPRSTASGSALSGGARARDRRHRCRGRPAHRRIRPVLGWLDRRQRVRRTGAAALRPADDCASWAPSIRCVDPNGLGRAASARRTAASDDVVPRAALDALGRAAGKAAEVRWYDQGHAPGSKAYAEGLDWMAAKLAVTRAAREGCQCGAVVARAAAPPLHVISRAPAPKRVTEDSRNRIHFR